MNLLQSLLGGVQGGLLLAGAALVAIVTAYFKGRSAGKTKAENTQLKDTLKKVDRINDSHSDNAGRTTDQLRDRLLNAQRRDG